MNTQANTYRTNAAFFIDGRWQWRAWNHREPNHHKAIFDKCVELGAKGYDTGNADHGELCSWPAGHP